MPSLFGKTIGSGSLLVQAGKVLGTTQVYTLLMFLGGIYYSRRLGAESKGIITYYLAVAALVAGFASVGLNNATIYFYKKKRTTFRSGGKRFLCVALPLCWIIPFLWFLVENYFVAEASGFWTVSNLLTIGCYGSIVSVALLLKSYFLGIADLRNYQIVLVVPAAVGLLTALILVELFGGQAKSVVFGYFLGELLGTQWAVRRLLAQDESRVKLDGPVVSFREMITYGLKGHLATLGRIVFARLDYLVIPAMVGMEGLGYYSVSKFFFSLFQLVPQSVSGLLLGRISGSDQERERSRLLTQSVFVLVGILSLGLVGVVLLGEIAIGWIYGPDFIQCMPALLILCLAAVIMGVTTPINSYLLGVGAPLAASVITLIAGIVKVSVLVPLVRERSIEGAALATLIGASVVCVGRLIVVVGFYSKRKANS